MRAVQIVEPGRVQLTVIPKPSGSPKSAMVRIRAFGLCGTDLNTFKGRNPLVSFPRIPGHELCGTVEALPDDYTGPIEIGESVTINPYTACGKCPACRAGRPNCCRNNETLGVQRDGGATEHLAVPADKLIAAPGLSDEQIACVEPLSVGCHAVSRAQIMQEEFVLIFGCGMIGLGAVAAAAFKGAKVIAVDIDDSKLLKARRIGAAYCVNSDAENLEDTVKELTGGEGPATVVEAVGRPETYRSAVELVAFAGRVVYIGYTHERVQYETALFVTKELDIRGSRNALPEDFRSVIEMLASGGVDVGDLITGRYAFDRTGEALAYWREHPQVVTKIHITL